MNAICIVCSLDLPLTIVEDVMMPTADGWVCHDHAEDWLFDECV